ncbi:MAG: hypothetical protein KA761_00035 [Gemmatimonadaceae bacterium]|nr:hypothetical protein [Gemmatimonadaceae bacterium]
MNAVAAPSLRIVSHTEPVTPETLAHLSRLLSTIEPGTWGIPVEVDADAGGPVAAAASLINCGPKLVELAARALRLSKVAQADPRTADALDAKLDEVDRAVARALAKLESTRAQMDDQSAIVEEALAERNAALLRLSKIEALRAVIADHAAAATAALAAAVAGRDPFAADALRARRDTLVMVGDLLASF